MKLIVYRTIDDREKYQDLLMQGLVWQRRGPKLLTYTEGVMYTYIDDSFAINYLRGYVFDEVLWVGFRDRLEVAGKAPVDLLAQLQCPIPKYHFCKPLEKKP